MRCVHGPGGLVPELGRCNDFGPVPNRWPQTDVSITPTQAGTGKIIPVSPLNGWVRFDKALDGANPTGWRVVMSGRSDDQALEIRAGIMLPAPHDGQLRLIGTDATGTLRVQGWSYEAGWILAITGGAAAADGGSTPTGTVLESVEGDGALHSYTPPAGTVFTVVTLYDAGSSAAVGTDATVPVDVGPAAQLSSWTHYGTDPIFYNAANTEFINFTNYTA